MNAVCFRILRRVILRLCMPQLIVFSALVRNQFFMRSLLYYCALVKHKYLIAEFAQGEAMTDVDCSLVPDYVIEFRINLSLSHRVKRRCRLVKNNERCVLVECPCYSYLLRLCQRLRQVP